VSLRVPVVLANLRFPCVQRREGGGGDADVAPPVAQLAADAVQEPLHRVLGAAVGRLERDPSVAER